MPLYAAVQHYVQQYNIKHRLADESADYTLSNSDALLLRILILYWNLDLTSVLSISFNLQAAVASRGRGFYCYSLPDEKRRKPKFLQDRSHIWPTVQSATQAGVSDKVSKLRLILHVIELYCILECFIIFRAFLFDLHTQLFARFR